MSPIEKPAETDYPIHDLLKRRWSPRAFSDRAVEPQKIKRLLEALRWSASSYNEQPWRLILATKDDSAAYEKVLGCLVEANQSWAKLAPVLLLTLSKKTFSKNGKPNRVHIHDIGLAMGNLSVQAMAMDLWVHQMAGVDLDTVREAYDVPDDFEPVTAAAIGYQGEVGDLPEPMREMEQGKRDRKPLPEWVFDGKGGFGDPHPLIAG